MITLLTHSFMIHISSKTRRSLGVQCTYGLKLLLHRHADLLKVWVQGSFPLPHVFVGGGGAKVRISILSVLNLHMGIRGQT